MLVDVFVASVLGGILLYMLLEQWCLVDNPPCLLVVPGDNAKILKPAATATTFTTVSKDPVEAVEEKIHQATDGHGSPTE